MSCETLLALVIVPTMHSTNLLFYLPEEPQLTITDSNPTVKFLQGS
jgi:hypothetical protein